MTIRTDLMIQLDRGATRTGVYLLGLLNTQELFACGKDAIQSLIDHWELLAKSADPVTADQARSNIETLRGIQAHAPQLTILPLDRLDKESASEARPAHFASLSSSARVMVYPKQHYTRWDVWCEAGFVSDNGTEVTVMCQDAEMTVPRNSWRIATPEEFAVLQANIAFFRNYMLASAEGRSVVRTQEASQPTTA